MWIDRRKLAVIAALPLLLGCLPAALQPTPTPQPSPTASSTPAPSPTATIIWFPATATPTQLATPAPTPTVFPLPERGDLLLSDDFSDSSVWTLAQSSRGGSALGVNELSIVLNEPDAYVSSTRVDVYLTNFF